MDGDDGLVLRSSLDSATTRHVCSVVAFVNNLSDDQENDEDQDLPLAGSDAAAKRPWLPIHVQLEDANA